MYPEFTHILIITIEFLMLNQTNATVPYPSTVPYVKGMMNMYDSYLKDTEETVSSIDPKIKKVFHYYDILLCLVELENSFEGLTIAQKTARLEPMVNSMFTDDVDQVYFNWMIREKDDVASPTWAERVVSATGSSGGSNIGSRGG